MTVATKKSDVQTTIIPKMVFASRSGPAITSMPNTLDRVEWEAVGSWFVHMSQDAGHWVSFERPDGGQYDDMVEAGYLIETKVQGGFQYELSAKAIKQIYDRQQEGFTRKKSA